jgi:hypothetical protein
MPNYPDVEVQLTGQDGNVFGIIAKVAQALRRAGHREAAEDFTTAAHNATSYDEVLSLALDTVEVS